MGLRRLALILKSVLFIVSVMIATAPAAAEPVRCWLKGFDGTQAIASPLLEWTGSRDELKMEWGTYSSNLRGLNFLPFKYGCSSGKWATDEALFAREINSEGAVSVREVSWTPKGWTKPAPDPNALIVDSNSNSIRPSSKRPQVSAPDTSANTKASAGEAAREKARAAREADYQARFAKYEQDLAEQQRKAAEFEAAKQRMAVDKAAQAERVKAVQDAYQKQLAAHQAEVEAANKARAEYEANLRAMENAATDTCKRVEMRRSFNLRTSRYEMMPVCLDAKPVTAE